MFPYPLINYRKFIFWGKFICRLITKDSIHNSHLEWEESKVKKTNNLKSLIQWAELESLKIALQESEDSTF